MRYLLTIWFILLAMAVHGQNDCFQAIQDGQPVQVICANKPVFFRDCSTSPDPNAIIFYYPGPDKYTNQTNVLTGEEQTQYQAPGTYIVTKFINKNNGQSTEIYEKTFTVKAADTPPAFTSKVCANNLVEVTITSTAYDAYTIDFGDGATRAAQPNSPLRYTYGSNGNYTITVTGNYTDAACSASASAQITTLPNFQLPYLQNVLVKQQGVSGEIQFDVQDLQPGYTYIIERYQDPRLNFQKIDTIRNITQSSISYTLRNVNTAEGVWYLIRIVDQCNSITSNSNSNIVSSIALEASAGNEQAQLNWRSMPGAITYEIYRNNTLLTTLNASINAYTDAGLSCGQRYTYYVKGIGADGSTSVSAPQTVEATSTITPPPAYVLASFNLNNEVELTVNLPQDKTAKTINIQKSINGGAYQNLAATQQLVFRETLEPLRPVCYRATFTDPCDNTSPVSNLTCPVILSGQKQTNGAIQLDWTPFTGFPDGVGMYYIELLDANGTVLNSTVANGTSYTFNTINSELPVLRYRIRAVSTSGNEISFSNLLQFEQEYQVFIPSAFTPNGDGLNDVLEVKGRFIQNYTLKVYNSLGNVIFQTSDRNTNWDGTYQGKALPTGAYAYELTIQTEFGTTKRKTGTVTLLR